MKTQLTATQKAAILVATLDRQTADLLLAQMTAEEAARVRRAVIELDDIPEALMAEALEEFRGITAGQRQVDSASVTWEPSGGAASYDDAYSAAPVYNVDRYPSGIELDDRLSAHMAAHAPAPTASAPRRPFRSLHEAEPRVLASFFEHEHPQTIAVVFSHLEAQQAADVLARLPEELQAEVLQRLADLDDTDETVVHEIEAGIESWLSQQDQRRRRRRAGLSAIEKILASAELGVKESMLNNLHRRDAGLAEHFGGPRLPEPARVSPPRKPVRSPESGPSPKQPVNKPRPATTAAPQRRATRLSFANIERLSDHALATVFSAADPVVVQLALAGAPHGMIQRLLNQLPARDARQLRKSLDTFGPVRLHDVEASQRHLAELASDLLAAGRFTFPRARAAA